MLFHDISFFFFLIIDTYILIPAVITQIFNPTAELTIPKEISTKESKVETETQLLTVETKTSNKFFVFLTHQIILFYFFNEIVSCFIYFFFLKNLNS